jgi:hypothetical protein
MLFNAIATASLTLGIEKEAAVDKANHILGDFAHNIENALSKGLSIDGREALNAYIEFNRSDAGRCLNELYQGMNVADNLLRIGSFYRRVKSQGLLDDNEE